MMERLETSLDDLLENMPGLPLSLKCSVLEDVASGLVYLHDRQPPVIHRDLTAKNVLLTSSLSAKITDMGNSCIVSMRPGQMARTLSQLPGTLVYMPPEALDDTHCYGQSLDVFSFGHLSLFTLTQVFPGNLLSGTYSDPDNPRCILGRSEVEHRGEYVKLLETRIHPGLVTLVKECLENFPDHRPATDEVLNRLQRMRVETEGEYGAYVNKLDIAKVRLIKDMKMKDRRIEELTQQEERHQAELREVRRQLQERTRELELKTSALEAIVEMEAKGGLLQRERQAKEEMESQLREELQSKEAEISRLKEELRRYQEQEGARQNRARRPGNKRPPSREKLWSPGSSTQSDSDDYLFSDPLSGGSTTAPSTTTKPAVRNQSKKPAAKPPTNKKDPNALFGSSPDGVKSESEDDLFSGGSSAKPVKAQAAKPPSAKTARLFSDSDDDLFSAPKSGKSSNVEPPPAKDPSPAPTRNKPVGAVSMFGGKDLFAAVSSKKQDDSDESSSAIAKKKRSISSSGKFGKSVEEDDVFTSKIAPEVATKPKKVSFSDSTSSNDLPTSPQPKAVLGINPLALKPGAAPPVKASNNKAVSFDEPPKVQTLSSLTKNRARRPGNKRPPSRETLRSLGSSTQSDSDASRIDPSLRLTSPDSIPEPSPLIAQLENEVKKDTGIFDTSKKVTVSFDDDLFSSGPPTKKADPHDDLFASSPPKAKANGGPLYGAAKTKPQPTPSASIFDDPLENIFASPPKPHDDIFAKDDKVTGSGSGSDRLDKVLGTSPKKVEKAKTEVDEADAAQDTTEKEKVKGHPQMKTSPPLLQCVQRNPKGREDQETQ